MVFGKNEEAVHKSISKEDVAFLKDLPNITIGYEKRLHAKFYASEDFAIITSMNLHQFSHNNNIEAGIKLKSNKWFKSGDYSTEQNAGIYFEEVIDGSKIIFEKAPEYKSAMLGWKHEYTHSTVKLDETENFFKQTDYVPNQEYKRQLKPVIKKIEKQGFCIRTGVAIPFNPEKPLSSEAYKSWAKFADPNYKEKFCHFSGEQSNGETCVSKPIMKKNWIKAKEFFK